MVNAGDGKHEHPTQALLDVYTLRERLGTLDGANIWIVGDVLHSRVARSNIMAFQKMGAKVTLAGPPTLIPRGIEALGCDVRFTLDGLREADVVYALRMQKERMGDSFVPSLREYAAQYQINGRRLGARQVLMHPGPVNRGVELAAEVTVCGPPTLIPRGIEALGCGVSYSLDGIEEAEVVYALRMQKERMSESFVPSLREYAANFQIDTRRLNPRQLLMHPGPVNRGVELSGEAIDSPQSLIAEQVAAGLVVRMAILYELLAGGDASAPITEDAGSRPTPIGTPA